MSKRIERPGVREGYDRWSETYDATPNPLVSLDRRHTLRALDPRPGGRVLDAGCGTGFLNHISDAGFQRLEWHEYLGDHLLLEEVPWASRYLGRPLLLLIRGERAV